MQSQRLGSVALQALRGEPQAFDEIVKVRERTGKLVEVLKNVDGEGEIAIERLFGSPMHQSRSGSVTSHPPCHAEDIQNAASCRNAVFKEMRLLGLNNASRGDNDAFLHHILSEGFEWHDLSNFSHRQSLTK